MVFAKSQYDALNNNAEKEKYSNFLQNSVVTNPIKEDELAYNQPIKFIKKYLNRETISNAIIKNPNIRSIIEDNNLSIEFNLENVNSIIMSHLIPTSKTAAMIYQKIGHRKSEENFLFLVQAALLHDIGKVFIPESILNKKGKLTLKERIIIETHNKLSYEILKTTDLNPKVAQLALEHHDYEKDVKRTEENQALCVADVFCALKEHRSYKKPLSDICAKTILYDMGTKGSFDTKYISYIN